MTFIELDDGTLLNPDNIVSATPLTSGSLRVAFVGGLTKDIGEPYAEPLRKELKAQTKKPRTTTKK